VEEKFEDDLTNDFKNHLDDDFEEFNASILQSLKMEKDFKL